nr:putative 5-formyltetrahydrofolate cyclo-ligase [Quercus suber]
MSTVAKKALRKEIKSSLAELSEDEVARQSLTAQDTILALPQYKEASRISVYLSMPAGEARTDRIVINALDVGKRVFVPFICSTLTLASPESQPKKMKIMNMLELHSVAEFRGLERDPWGIPYLPQENIAQRENAAGGRGLSPSTVSQENVGGLELVVVPGVAFDHEMNRIGHGAGFYDTFLTQFINEGKRPRPFLVGRISMESWDWKVDAVATGEGQLLRPS